MLHRKTNIKFGVYLFNLKQLQHFDGRFLIESNCGIVQIWKFEFRSFYLFAPSLSLFRFQISYLDASFLYLKKLFIQFVELENKKKKLLPIVSQFYMWLLLKDKYFCYNAVVTLIFRLFSLQLKLYCRVIKTNNGSCYFLFDYVPPYK